ncbi:SDR family NAD(P)-dependent oxidoreductase [Shouchella clausii]|uniref:Short-chain dehydrogenase n=1 Tax=Shouchella clausii TaxID=79880 RepID=A0A268S6A3_SHOCL|nr:SDR family oxidoreductase [Shouchella clausii]PAD43951.1 short-chain dehydrogenase [Bacillus sp. 7520-S]MBU8596959.1 SDR family oxidoreductase [Shouchella clausii]MCY1105980.1 SDR family oxidoreductase [Shouchella clausii]MED4157405.1 SDR family oxidoreductase [Shouchella clausii]MED4175005.1 SDR family oxidoreductase [Shouchella clausii]
MISTQKVALVTGGSRGLGRNAAIALSRKGIDVIITYHTRKDEADKVVQEIENSGRKAAAIQLDTGNVSSLDAFVSRLSAVLHERWNQDQIDILVNNAGFGINASVAETTEAQFDNIMNVQFKGVFFLSQKLFPRIVDNGRVVNISTGLTRFVIEGFGAYAAMKGAVEVLTKYMAKEWGKRGIRINVVAPGAIATDFGGGAVRDNPQMNEHVASNIALGRVGEADDIGGVIASLCTEEFSWVNGTRLEVSGGQML